MSKSPFGRNKVLMKKKPRLNTNLYTYIVIFNNKIKFYIICKHCIFCPFRILISTNLDYFDGSFAIQNCLQNDNSLDGTKIQKETYNPITNTLNLTGFFLKITF